MPADPTAPLSSSLTELLLRMVAHRLPAAAHLALIGPARQLEPKIREQHPLARVWSAETAADLSRQGARNLDLLVVIGDTDPLPLWERTRGGGAVVWSPSPPVEIGADSLAPWTTAGFQVEQVSASGQSPLALRSRLRRALGAPASRTAPSAARLRRWSGTGEH
jgi:hypothetical protein